MRSEQATEHDIRFVVRNLRELDRRELEATGCDLDALPEVILRNSVFCFVAVDDLMMPHAIWGLMQQRPGVGTGFAFGTAHWDKAVLCVLKNIRRFVMRHLMMNNYHRVECLALSHRKDVERFLELIGAYPEAVLRQWGCNGEDFTAYRWLRDEYSSERLTATVDRHVAH